MIIEPGVQELYDSFWRFFLIFFFFFFSRFKSRLFFFSKLKRVMSHSEPGPVGPRSSDQVVFDVIVVTASSESQAQAFQLELTRRQKFGLIPHKTLVVTVPDPSGIRIGSGGATFNAIAHANYHLSSSTAPKREFPRLLILHSGGDSKRSPFCSVVRMLCQYDLF